MSVLSAELPRVVLDALATEAAPARLLVVNRNPEPSSTDYPQDGSPQFDLLDTGAVPGIDVAYTTVRFNGVDVYNGQAGGFQPGYSGSVQTPAANVRRFVIDPAADLDSLLVVTVRVISRTTDLAVNIDVTWTFTVEDTTPPRLLTVDPRTPLLLRVAYNETVDDTALEPSRYVFGPEASGVIVMPTTGAKVTRVSGSVVDVEPAAELTFGARYALTVTGVKDAWGNVIEAPYDRFAFTSARPPTPTRRSFDLWSMLPAKNRREDNGDLRKFITALQDTVDLLLWLIDKWAETFDIDYAPENFVDALLADLGNPFGDLVLTLAEKRRLGRVLLDVYRQKGVGPGVVNAVNLFLGLTVTVVPYAGEALSLGESELGFDWTLGIGTQAGLYSFDVVSTVGLTADQRAKIRRIVNYMKPAHTHFINLLEPTPPVVIDHLVLGESTLGGPGVGNEGTWDLHG